MNADGTNQRVITGSRPYSEAPVTWSPDSKWLIAQNSDYGNLDVIEVATGNILPLWSGAGYVSLSWK